MTLLRVALTGFWRRFLAITACCAAIGTSSAAEPMATPPTSVTSQPFVYVSGYAPDIACFRLDTATGALTPSSSSPGGRNPSFLAWSPDRRALYAVNETGGGGRVLSFRIDPRDGALMPLGNGASGGNGPCHVSVHPSGRWVFAANYSSGHVAVLPVRADGGVGEPVDVHLAGSNAHMAITDQAGRFLFVPCLGSDHVAVYRIDAGTGRLTPNEPATVAVVAKAGPRHLAFHPSERFAYVINELDSSLTRFAYDPARGVLSDPSTVPMLPAGFAGKNTCAHVLVAPGGARLYGSNRGHDSLALFRLDPATGAPGLVAHETGGGEIRKPRHFTIDPTGTLALVASQGADLVTVLRIDPADGRLTRLHAQAVGKGPTFVGVMPAP